MAWRECHGCEKCKSESVAGAGVLILIPAKIKYYVRSDIKCDPELAPVDAGIDQLIVSTENFSIANTEQIKSEQIKSDQIQEKVDLDEIKSDEIKTDSENVSCVLITQDIPLISHKYDMLLVKEKIVENTMILEEEHFVPLRKQLHMGTRWLQGN